MPRRYIIALIAIALVFFGAVILLISILNSNGDDVPKPNSPESSENQKDFKKDADEVTFTTYGPVVGDNERWAVRITVNKFERVVEYLSGYQEAVIDEQFEDNNDQAYEALLIALDTAGFNRLIPDFETDQRSQCLKGKRYSFGIQYFEFDDAYSWATSCSKKQGSFRGDRDLVEDLMRDQITDYKKFVSGAEKKVEEQASDDEDIESEDDDDDSFLF